MDRALMTTLRRRTKKGSDTFSGRKRYLTPFSPEAATPGAPRSRRRARPDAPVPPELLLRPDRKAAAPRMASEAVLVTGFEPFGGEAMNPSWEVCQRLPREIAGLRVETCRVPCVFHRAIEVVAQAVERARPALVICLGLAPGRTHVGVERVAINVDDARNADNAGARPIDEPIAADGPPAYFATLPVKAMVAALRGAGVPAEVSNSAGTYVCNHLMYGVLHFLATRGIRARAGFVHLPFAAEQALDRRDTPSLPLATMAAGIEAAIAAALRTARDPKLAGGALD
jgi:pyroglutamyl-peptidase